jgi:hypothetical protein
MTTGSKTHLVKRRKGMRAVRFVSLVALLSLAAVAFAQSTAHQHDAQVQAEKASPSEAQKSFALLKTLAGEWEGPVKTDLPTAGMDGGALHVTMRVTSRGNLVVHEMQEPNTPLDPAKYDHPVTMLYLDADQMNLVHYCDAGNRPRMTGKLSADGKTVEFEFADIGGSTKPGHMHHAIFTAVDASHHTEDWTFILPNGQAVRAHFDLHRVI